jgi:uncharacterized protein YprB with RNaseH-like and TPR domain
VDLKSRLRAIVQPAGARSVRELTYEPDVGAYEAGMPIERVGELLGGRAATNAFGECLVIDRRYESDRWHGDVRIAECEIGDAGSLGLLDPQLAGARTARRTVFVDLETTGLSGGAGTVAFLVGCGFFDLGAFQVRQFLLTSYSAERALLTAVAEFFDDADLIVSYNGKTFDLPVMETRWLFHRMEMPLEGVPHFDALHTARRLWKPRAVDPMDGGCRLSTLERTLFDVRRVGDVPGFEIPSRFFHFMRSGDPRPLEPVLEHNRLDLVSLAAVTARAVRLVAEGADGCPDGSQALAVGRIYERAGLFDRAEACYRRAASTEARAAATETRADATETMDVRCESLYRLGLRCRRERRFTEAVAIWRELLALTEPRWARRQPTVAALRQYAVEALAIHHEHRDRDLETARDLAMFALKERADQGRDDRRADGYRHRLARLERKLEKEERKLEKEERKLERGERKLEKENAQLLWS